MQTIEWLYEFFGVEPLPSVTHIDDPRTPEQVEGDEAWQDQKETEASILADMRS